VGFDAFQWSIAVSLGGVGAQDRDGQKHYYFRLSRMRRWLRP